MYAEGYELLANILTDAFEQASTGKGKERHGRGLPWHEQAIFTLGRQYGPGGTGFQAAKKIGEAMGMIERGDYEAAEREILGTIVYAAATVALVREKAKAEKQAEVEALKNAVPVDNAIPDRVEWDVKSLTFHDHARALCYVRGSAFYDRWFSRRDEFPKWIPKDIPDGYEWDENSKHFYDKFQNARVSNTGEFHLKWYKRRDEFPAYNRFPPMPVR